MDFRLILDNIIGQWELFVRLVFACICGAIIGLERSHRRKDAGIKTHIILALGAALFMIVSQVGFDHIALSDTYRADVSRIASNIVTGVSFLCAGVIFVRGGSVKGLTTATGIWATAGIGMAAGAGMYAITFFATILILIIQTLFYRIATKLESHGTMDITLVIKENEDVNSKVQKITEYAKNKPNSIKISKNDNGTIVVKMSIHVQYNIGELELLDKIKAENEISDITWST